MPVPNRTAMLIVCPTCASEYTIDPERVGPTGRVVRCAACREPWFIRASEIVGDDREVDATERRMLPAARREPNPPPTGSVRTGTTGSALLARTAALSLVAVIAAAVTFRGPIVRVLPESGVVFAALGLSVNLVGLDLERFTSQTSQGATGRLLTVSGEISNPTARALPVPRLALQIEGERGEALYDWTDAAAEAELQPHATTRFEARLPSPPPEGHRIVVTFSTAQVGPKVASR